MSRQGRRENRRQLSCPRGDRGDCDEVAPYDCYSTTTRQECCETCRDFRVTDYSPVSGCQFGDKIGNCSTDRPWRCYDNNYRDDCCYTCYTLYSPIQGCEYGDRVGNCLSNECNIYSASRRHDCCETCPPPDNPTYSTTSPGVTQSTFTDTGADRNSDGPSDWIVPVACSIGGILLIVLLIAVVCLWRRKCGTNSRSPIDEKMYNDYKMSKRPPLALPRDQNVPDDKLHENPLVRQNSAEYAYINPEEVARSSPDGPRRSGDDPLPAPPSGHTEYLQFGDADKYGYLEAIGTTVKPMTPPGPDRPSDILHDGIHRLNTYHKFPVDSSHEDSSRSYHQLQSYKM